MNAIAPGGFMNELSGGLQKDKSRFAVTLGRIPMGRWGEPEEPGGVALDLVFDASIHGSGHNLVIDEG
jgi:NAD(P)-dependent dehydrogenase (short-subunit alcohol dehydrogenase family)